MDKLKMRTANKADENFKRLAEMFPNAVTETINENGCCPLMNRHVLSSLIPHCVMAGTIRMYFRFTH